MKEIKHLKEAEKFINEQLGGQILHFRINEKLWTQEELAQQSGLTRNHIHLIEKGKRNIRVTTLRNIAQAYDITVSELCGFTFHSEDQKYYLNGTHF